MFKTIFILLFSTILILGCKKDKDLTFSINGTVLDESFNNGLANATVIIFEKPVASFDLKEIGRVQTDGDGKYSLKFPRNRVESYVVKIQKDFYFDKTYTILFNDLDPKKSIEYNFGTTAYSWVKIHLKNVNEVNAYDDFIYKKTKGKVDCADCCPAEELHFYGALDTTFYCISDDNKPFAYYYELRNTTNLGVKEQNTVPFDTITLTTTY